MSGYRLAYYIFTTGGLKYTFAVSQIQVRSTVKLAMPML